MYLLSVPQIYSWSAHSSPPKSQATIDGVPCAQNSWKKEHTKESEPISDEMLTFMSTDEIEDAIMK